VVAVPSYPPDPTRLARSVPRLEAIARDAECGAVLTTQAIHALAGMLHDQAPRLRDIPWLASDQLTGRGPEWRAPACDAGATALLQYTSGSTGQPRGVVLTHANLLHNQQLIRQAFRTGPEASVVSWLPLYHDMGLIGTVLHPVFLGTTAYLMSPLAFLQRPLRWLQAIANYRGGYSGGPSFAFELCVRKITPAERRQLDLSCWQVAFCGAEPVRAATIEAFAAAFAGCGFRRDAFQPTYGLAESTLIATGGHARGEGPKVRWFAAGPLGRGEVVAAAGEPGARALVGCGTPLDGTELRIVDESTRAVAAAGRVGEIWLRGPSVASGYFNRAAETAGGFGAVLEGAGEPAFLRTGDLGFLWEDELFFAGRLKDILIVRGKKLFPQDLEATVEQVRPGRFRPGCASAFSIEVEGEDRVVVVQEVSRGESDPAWLERAAADAAQAVFEESGIGLHAIVLIAAGELPKTSSGKVQRHAAREHYLAGRFHSLVASPIAWAAVASGPSAPTIAARIARLRPLVARYAGGDPSQIADDRPVSALGLDSLTMVELHADIEAQVGTLPIAVLLGGSSLRDVAIAMTDPAPAAPIAPRAAAESIAARVAWSWPAELDDELRSQLIGFLGRVLATDDTVGYPGPLAPAQGAQAMDQLARDLAHRRCQVLIGRLDGRVVAQCTLVPSGFPNSRHLGSIYRGMVDPEIRTGNLLPIACGHLVERCRELGVEVLCIDTRVGSRAAALWQALGFQEFGRLPDYSRVGPARYAGLYLYQRVDDLARAIAAP
jgi:acyl-CoA synthetase (AMP-forming)/AMP-acid ligase II